MLTQKICYKYVPPVPPLAPNRLLEEAVDGLLPKTFATPAVCDTDPNRFEEGFTSGALACSLLAPNTLATPAEELPNKLGGGVVNDLGSLGFAPNTFALLESPELNNDGAGAVRLLLPAGGAPNKEDFTIPEPPAELPNRGFIPEETEDVPGNEEPPVTPNPGDGAEPRAPGGGIPNRPLVGAFFLSGGEDLLP